MGFLFRRTAKDFQNFVQRALEYNLPVSVAFIDEIPEAFAFNIFEVADDPYAEFIGACFLKYFACESRRQIIKCGIDIRPAEDYFFDRKIRDDIEQILRAIDFHAFIIDFKDSDLVDSVFVIVHPLYPFLSGKLFEPPKVCLRVGVGVSAHFPAGLEIDAYWRIRFLSVQRAQIPFREVCAAHSGWLA
jgi:hypothetical protein